MLVAALSASLVHAYDPSADTPSRAPTSEGVKLGQVFNLGMPGLKYPSKFLNFSSTVEREGLEDQLTPVGLRQHYFIGNEYRERYIVEGELFNADYLVAACDLQSPFQGSSIESLQAQMMGLYPGSDMNDLNEWQQGNAVPPTDADYSAWQAELGAKALPYGLNTFPIF